ncbi:hypothetical protein [Miltoncostaea oceani]|uniref:hypothetical protein n=1 Tax=Miltoncostaea oceani TaxID=2843216 RepID=UPI001C3DEED4|nr:hypothetical protein [Miltoncostaea oceani]
MPRRLVRQIIQIEILREDEPLPEDLVAIADEITTGDSSGNVRTLSVEDLTGPQMAAALIAQGSDPEFLGLDADGKDLTP